MPLTLHSLSLARPLLPALAAHLIAQHRQQLPDLSGVLILVPIPELAPALRQALLDAAGDEGINALLGLEIQTLGAWARQHAAAAFPVISNYQRELILVNELKHHTDLYGAGSPWTLTENLLALFDELSLEQIQFPRDGAQFHQQIRTAYGVAAGPLPPLEDEARLVHTLWRAWHEHMASEHLLDQASAHVIGLQQSLQHLDSLSHIYLAGFYQLHRCEWQWLKTAADHLELDWFTQNSSDIAAPKLQQQLQAHIPAAAMVNDAPADNYDAWLSAVFAPQDDTSLPARAQAFRSRYEQSPAEDRLRVFAANGTESQAQAIVIQAGLWLQAGVRDIAIVTEDRKLARRLRALLERHGIVLKDTSGWVLSTTRAAAVVERWLQVIEEDFYHQPLLDLLKSPFLELSTDRDGYLYLVHRFERDVVRTANIARGMSSYQQQLKRRELQYGAYRQTADDISLAAMLDTLRQAAAPLQKCLSGNHGLAYLLTQLSNGLEILGMRKALAGDAAGIRVLQELELMTQAAQESPITLNWLEFRSWLGQAMERYNFIPPTPAGSIQLCSLRQTLGRHFGGVIIAAAESRHYPGNPTDYPFFNSRVRYQLGLEVNEDHYQTQFYLFSRLLQAAPQILVSRRREENGEDIAPTPWLSLIQDFHLLCYQHNLTHASLEALLVRHTQLANSTSPPRPMTQPPSPAVIAELLPANLSASGFQTLLDCPYKYFAGRCLGLQAAEEVSEVLGKADYGQYIHRCLEAFHKGVPSLPGPIGKPLTPETLAEAASLLARISEQIFFQDLEDNFLHRMWLQRWLQRIDLYLEWQLRQEQAGARFQDAEIECRIQNGDILAPQGRIDRIDQAGDGFTIIDYKTGATPDKKTVEAGEAIQLYFYAYLLTFGSQKPVARVLYLKLDSTTIQEVSPGSDLIEPAVNQLIEVLQTTRLDMKAGKPLLAWGDTNTCRFCDFSGLCRKDHWEQKGL